MQLVDYDRNLKDGIDAANLYINSTVFTNWKCAKNHYFKEKVKVMYRRKNKCFFCSGRQIWSGDNDLETLYPEIAREFDVKKNGITPDKISPRDRKVYWWACQNNHPSYERSVEHRINRDAGCTFCSGKKVISGVNDLKTLFPEIADEYDYEKNKGVFPEDINPFSYIFYWWKCPKGHSYKKKVILRTKFHKPIDCPKCVKAQTTSFPEQAIYYYIKKCFPDAVNQYKEIFEHGMELDVYIPSYRVGIEYDGIAFHNDEEQHEREKRKYQVCLKQGIRLIRIKESKDTWTDTADEIFYVKQRMKDDDFSLFLTFMFSQVFSYKMHTFTTNTEKKAFFNHYYGFPTDFNIARDKAEILEYLVDVEHSFGMLYPEQAELWDKEKNSSLTPFMFTPGSNYEPIWKCPECGNNWSSPVHSIVSRKVTCCKTCSMSRNGKNWTKSIARKEGSLGERSEKLLKQWDKEANGELSPFEIPLGYSKKVAWKCDVCGFKWSSSPNSRVGKDRISDCPHCTGRVAMLGVDDFETLYPDIAKEWDYELNGKALPSGIKPYTNKKYYWKCLKCGDSYAAYPGQRIKGSGCPICARKEIGKKNSKTVGQFDDEGKLINTFYGLHEAARTMHVVPNSIFQAVKFGKKSKGYYWRYLNNE